MQRLAVAVVAQSRVYCVLEIMCAFPSLIAPMLLCCALCDADDAGFWVRWDICERLCVVCPDAVTVTWGVKRVS